MRLGLVGSQNAAFHEPAFNPGEHRFGTGATQPSWACPSIQARGNDNLVRTIVPSIHHPNIDEDSLTNRADGDTWPQGVLFEINVLREPLVVLPLHNVVLNLDQIRLNSSDQDETYRGDAAQNRPRGTTFLAYVFFAAGAVFATGVVLVWLSFIWGGPWYFTVARLIGTAICWWLCFVCVHVAISIVYPM